MEKKEIPGYYYDTVKKKYFAITKEFKPPNEKLKIIENHTKEKKNDNIKKCTCLPIDLHNRALHGSSLKTLRKRKQKSLIKDINFDVNAVKSFDDRGFSPLAVKINKTGQSLAMQMRPDGSLYLNETLCLYNVVREKKCYAINFECDTELNLPGSRISSFTWSPNEDHQLLFSLVKEHLLRPGFVMKSSELALLSKNGLVTLKRYNKKIIECIAWNTYPKDNSLICTGEKGGVVKFKDVNLYGHYVQPFVTNTSPQVMTFCTSSPCLFIGCKSGIVYQYDYRLYSPVHFKCTKKSQNYRVDCLHVLQDENYLMVSNWNGDIYKMDVRLRKTVMEYKGHVNNHSKLTFHVDGSDNFMFAVGSDSCIRCWDIQTGCLEYVYQVTKTTGIYGLPVIDYSSSWSGDETFSGLLCTYDSKFEMWPLVC